MSNINLHYQLEPNTTCRCCDCAWAGPAKDLGEIVDAQERLYPGETVPAGQCPDCNALAHVACD